MLGWGIGGLRQIFLQQRQEVEIPYFLSLLEGSQEELLQFVSLSPPVAQRSLLITRPPRLLSQQDSRKFWLSSESISPSFTLRVLIPTPLATLF